MVIGENKNALCFFKFTIVVISNSTYKFFAEPLSKALPVRLRYRRAELDLASSETNVVELKRVSKTVKFGYTQTKDFIDSMTSVGTTDI